MAIALPLASGARLRQVLALMEVDRYVRRQPAPASAALGVPDWSDDALARALARAAGHADVATWQGAWIAAGEALPDLAGLRADGAAKRALWQRMRRRRR